MGRHVNACSIEGVRWIGTKRNSGGGKNSGPVLSRLWTKVHEIFGQRTRPLVLSNDEFLATLVKLLLSGH